MPEQRDQTQTSWTIGKLLKSTTDHLRTNGVDEPRLSAEILLAEVMKCARILLYARFDDPCSVEQLDQYRELVRAAAKQTPIAYLVGRKEFYSLDFRVSRDVLIPRPETECLVEHAVELAKKHEGDRFDVLDLGTGSGCVIVTVAVQFAGMHGVGTDVSEAALAVARGNASRHEVSERISFAVADRLALPEEIVPGDGFDLIVSNPPYVAQDDMAGLPPNVRDHEPHIALTPGGDGLGFYRDIADHGHRFLKAGGNVLVEIGAGQGLDVISIFRSSGRFGHGGTYRNGNDPHDRVMLFCKV